MKKKAVAAIAQPQLSTEPMVYIAIKKIRQLFFSVNQDNYRHEPEATMNFEQQLSFNDEADMAELRMRTTFLYDSNKEPYIQVEVQNIFEIKDLKKYRKPGDPTIMMLPDSAIITMVSLAISHTRVYISAGVAGTVFNDTILPILNPMHLAKNYLGEVRTHLTPNPITRP